MTDPKQDRLGAERPMHKSITMSDRDIADARRLFELLSGKAPEGDASVPRTLYDRLRTDRALLERRARQMITLRQRRQETFGKAMFGEPAWDILLVLYTAGGGLTMNRLADMAGLSAATGFRWMNYLADQRLIVREPHPTDARSLRVMLTDKGKASLDAYLSAAAELGDS